MRKEWIILLVLIAGLLTSCSGSNSEPVIEPESVEEESITPEAKPREALFVYQDKTKIGQQEIELKLNAAPLLLSDSYVRLAGVVSGGKPIALIEIGGRGQLVRSGDRISGYRVIWIGEGMLKLSKEAVH